MKISISYVNVQRKIPTMEEALNKQLIVARETKADMMLGPLGDSGPLTSDSGLRTT